MYPSFVNGLQWVAGNLKKNIYPGLTDFYLRNEAIITVNILKSAIEKADTLVEDLVEENRALEALLVKGENCIEGFDREVPTEFDGSGFRSLKVSTLTALNESLRKSMVRLHRLTEKTDSPEAQELDREIWQFSIQIALNAQFDSNIYFTQKMKKPAKG